jgi:hypothetical protein
MIDINYGEGQIKINTNNLTSVLEQEQLPLIIKIKNSISKDVVWETRLESNMWASYPKNELKDVIVEDSKGNFIYRYNWDVMQHGSIFYKSLWLYCKGLINKGEKPVGLVIGTHDGEFGEWVPLAKNFMSDMLLVEASETQFNRLTTNYKGKSGLSFLQELITTDGEDVEFFEGGKGYTNTVVKRVIDYWETEEVRSTNRTSISINQLIKDNFYKKLDWLHLDVEGLDAKLLMSMESETLPNFIIFEDFNLDPEEKMEITSWFENQNYQLHSEGGICMSIKR